MKEHVGCPSNDGSTATSILFGFEFPAWKVIATRTQELDNLDNLSFAVKHTRKLLVMLTSVLVKETQRDLIHTNSIRPHDHGLTDTYKLLHFEAMQDPSHSV